MNVEQLKRAVGDGSIDTVLLVFADMQGRLQGKRLVGKHFVDEVLEHDAEACNYLLAVDVDMNTVEGYTMSSWSTGYGDFVMKPHLETLRPVPWHDKTAMCMADLVWHDESPVVASPRQILRRQLDRLAERGWSALAATELEFIVFRDTYEEAFDKGYKDLVPGNQYNVDYSILGTSRLEPLLGRIRREMAAADLEVENSKGECNFGQHEINFTYEDALGAADTHAIYKNGAKEIASQEGMAITFMAKYDEREGNSCHIHLSLRGKGDKPVFADQPEVFDRFLAGQLACMRDLTLFLAPNINSYKRFAEGSFAPTAVAWGRDNRTCSMRVIGHGPSLRIESRVAGGDVNPYLAIAAMIASGLHGVDNELELEPVFEGNAYTSDKPHVPQHPPAGARPVRGQRRRARGVRRGRRTRTTSTAPTSSSGRSKPLSPTGNARGASSGCDAAGPRARHRGGARGDPARGRRGGGRRRRAREGGVPGLARGRARRPRGAPAPAGRRARRRARAARACSRRATPASRSATRAARCRWWSTPSATTRPGRSATSATRSPSPAASG